MELLDIFRRDQYIRQADSIEWNQVFKYDNFIKETPILSAQLALAFSDEGDAALGLRAERKRRGGVILDNRSLIDIVPGWNITEVQEQEQ